MCTRSHIVVQSCDFMLRHKFTPCVRRRLPVRLSAPHHYTVKELRVPQVLLQEERKPQAPCLLLSAARTRGDLCYCDLGINLGRILGVPSHKATPSSQTTLNTSDDSNSSDSDDKSSPDKTQGKRKCKTQHAEDPLSSHSSKNLLFDPDALLHPRSTEWTPCQEVPLYVQSRLRKSSEKDIRSTLRSECPRPALSGKVAETPELDPHMVTFLNKIR
ncbi:hypothetical protein NDU88_004802 [Pleurodeles waltl]|uniref:Uncharacterized protein n=1 Tax=Pleurodeles waltl TaxID=8319 RepID=A0AAV7V2R3_PLEWA|nr:hypothetical protein NDU88_004802 [Pleurodeles waltl]